MANKRNVKKEIRNICGAMAAELLSAAACIEGFDEARVNELVGRIAALQVNGLSHCTFAFDKTPADFASPRAFNAARRAYNRAAFNKLAEDTRAEVNAILKEMNSMLPQSVRDAVKAQA
ncbi:MAG: hypothetical protein K2F72_02900 [Muribaculaceae bacterium]|nr:hypothetical protein [Muribaculaceae bacterium]